MGKLKGRKLKENKRSEVPKHARALKAQVFARASIGNFFYVLTNDELVL